MVLIEKLDLMLAYPKAQFNIRISDWASKLKYNVDH